MSNFGGGLIWAGGIAGLLALTILGSFILLRKIRSLGTWMLCIGAVILATAQFIDAIRMIAMVHGGLPWLRDLPDGGQNVYNGMLDGAGLLWVGGGVIAPIGLFLFACKARPKEPRTHNKAQEDKRENRRP